MPIGFASSIVATLTKIFIPELPIIVQNAPYCLSQSHSVHTTDGFRLFYIAGEAFAQAGKLCPWADEI